MFKMSIIEYFQLIIRLIVSGLGLLNFSLLKCQIYRRKMFLQVILLISPYGETNSIDKYMVNNTCKYFKSHKIFYKGFLQIK